MGPRSFYHSSFLLWLLAALLFFAASCTSVYLEKEAAASLEFVPPESGNSLISFETGITLPEGWQFFLSENDGALFRFVNSSNTVSGYLEWCDIGFPLSDNEMLKFMEEKLLNDYTIIRIIPAEKKTNTSYVAEYVSADGTAFYSMAVLPLDLGFYLLELRSETLDSGELTELCTRIAAGIRNAPAGYFMRNIPGTVQVHDISGMWNWVADIPGGTVLYRYLPGYTLCSAAVYETETDSLESLLDSDKYTLYTTDFIINNRITSVSAAGRDLPGGPELHVFIEGEKNYIVSFAVEDEDGKFESKTLLEREELQTFFLSALTFGGF